MPITIPQITLGAPSFSTIDGKKTYITSILAIAYIWLDYFYHIGLSDSCKAALAANPAVECTLTLSTCALATFAALGLMAGRSAIGKLIDAAQLVIPLVAQLTASSSTTAAATATTAVATAATASNTAPAA